MIKQLLTAATFVILVGGIGSAQQAKAGRAAPAKAVAVAVQPQRSCEVAINAAEISHAIPTGLLIAIAKVESGRLDPGTGLVKPWPWTIDIDAKGSFFVTREEAVAFVEDAQQQGIQSIDVGCMQVNLLQHPDAFATLEDAFDPVRNANYAASFLVALQHETGDWLTAAGLYHSRTEALAAPYRDEVVQRFTGSASMLKAAPRPADVLAAAWAATLSNKGGAGTTLHLWPKPAAPVARIKSPGTQTAWLVRGPGSAVR